MVIQHGDVKWIHVGTDEQFANWKASPFLIGIHHRSKWGMASRAM
jgi:hypothetical protein